MLVFKDVINNAYMLYKCKSMYHLRFQKELFDIALGDIVYFELCTIWVIKYVLLLILHFFIELIEYKLQWRVTRVYILCVKLLKFPFWYHFNNPLP